MLAQPVACVGNAKTVHTRCILTIASGGAHSRNRITQSFRFIRPANVSTNNRNFFIRTVRSSGPKHNPRCERLLGKIPII